MHITVARIDSKTKEVILKSLDVPQGTTLKAALERLGLKFSYETTGLWCHSASSETVLREGDRIDIATHLVINRVEARRLRAQKTEKPARSHLARHGGKHQIVK